VPSRRRKALAWLAVALALAIACVRVPAAWPHDIPNARIDRSTQVTVTPGRVQIDYEVSLTELTLTQDLRALAGGLPGADRAEWLARYGQVTGPMNAKGILAAVDGQPLEFAHRGYDLALEEHPRYTFHFDATIPTEGRLSVRDTNFVSSEGTSRLAVRGRGGVVVAGGDDLPTEVDQIEIRPFWLLSDAEERRTKQVEVRYRSAPAGAGSVSLKRHAAGDEHGIERPAPPLTQHDATPGIGRGLDGGAGGISRLLDETTKVPWLILVMIAVGLGAAHAIQPGHGKTLVAAAAIGPGARFYQPALLGIGTTLAHMGSVLLLAAALWYTGATRLEAVHQMLTKVAGFAIAAVGTWRVGRYLGGFEAHHRDELDRAALSNRALFGLGLAGGMVPCWDAVGLLVLAAALGRLAAGVGLVLAFSVGMAVVLVAVGAVAWKLKSRAFAGDREPKWQRALGIAGGMMLAAIGLFLFLQS
jgi:nickel/cobalt transporter (NicO) family protein